MEGLLSDLKRFYFVDCGKEEVRDIQSAITELLTKYKEYNNSQDHLFKIQKLEMCGSMAEETRAWSFDTAHDKPGAERKPVIEFDFLAILSRGRDLETRTLESCYGYMNIFKRSSKGRFNTIFRANGGYLSPQDVAECFQSALIYSAVGSCNCKDVVYRPGLSVIRNSLKREEVCSKCTAKRKTGYLTVATELEFGLPSEKQCNLIFKWTSISNSMYAKDSEHSSEQPYSLNQVFVLVDVLPAYALHAQDSELCDDGMRWLVPKSCKLCSHRLCWRVSNSTEEIKIIHSGSDLHRHVYMALKILVSISFPESGYSHFGIPSYFLKTVFLQHVENCRDRSSFYECLCNLLHTLSIAFELKELANNFTNHNMLDRYRHLGQDFYEERQMCLMIILHIVQMSDLTEEKQCSLDSMRPYLSSTKIIFEKLKKQNETMGSYLILNTNRTRASIRYIMSSIRDERNKTNMFTGIDLLDRDRSSYKGRTGEDSITENSNVHSSHLGSLRAPEILYDGRETYQLNYVRRKAIVEKKKYTRKEHYQKYKRFQKSEEKQTQPKVSGDISTANQDPIVHDFSERSTQKKARRQKQKDKQSYETVASYICSVQ